MTQAPTDPGEGPAVGPAVRLSVVLPAGGGIVPPSGIGSGAPAGGSGLYVAVSWEEPTLRSADAVEVQVRMDAGAWQPVTVSRSDPALVDVPAGPGSVIEARVRPAGTDAWSMSEPGLVERTADRQLRLVDASSASLLIAGDIAGCDWDADSATADLVADWDGLVMTAGDNAYEAGTDEDFQACYDPTWGRALDRTRPVPGNHEYGTPGAAGYFRYFGKRAGPVGRGWYAFDHGTWRIYALDSDCELTGQCREGSRQYRWLKGDLVGHPRRCVMAVLHHPRFSSGPHGNSRVTMPLLRLLYRAGAEVIVNGHDHIYERFAPARPWGARSQAYGMRQFIVGTGGAPLYGWKSSGRPAHSVVRQNQVHGVLRLDLAWNSYTWRFLSVAGGHFEDAGSGTCHAAPPIGRRAAAGAKVSPPPGSVPSAVASPATP
jgi:hypothetical protein